MKNIVAITSNSPRHVAFIDRLISKARLKISMVLVIDKKNDNEDFVRSEAKYFKEINFPKWCQVVSTRGNSAFSSRTKELLRSLDPEVGFVFGGPLLPPEIITIPKKGFVNLHTGIVQEYRGVDSPYWAIYENNPKGIGATIHYVDNNIDTGNIIAQRQTQGITIDDSPEDIFMKTCITGFDLLEEYGYNILTGLAKGTPLLNKGKLFQVKNMTPEIMNEIRSKTPKVIGDFLNGNYSRSV